MPSMKITLDDTKQIRYCNSEIKTCEHDISIGTKKAKIKNQGGKKGTEYQEDVG